MIGGRDEVHVTVSYNDRPVGDEVVPSGGAVSAKLPVDLRVLGRQGKFTLAGDFGDAGVDGGDPVAVQRGAVTVTARVVKRFRLPRWVMDSSHMVLPLVMLCVGVLGAQLTFLLQILISVFASGGGGAALPEPSPEYLTRLLNEDYAGEEQGLIAKPSDRPVADTKIESFYLQPGSAGPKDKPGGGKVVGTEQLDGDQRSRKAPEAAIEIVEIGTTENLAPQPDPAEPDINDLADPLASAEGDQVEHRQQVEVTEGWGLTDWYDTQDARRDANEIEEELKFANKVLKLDPDNVYGLSIRAYYEYLAMDFAAADATYEHLLRLDGVSGAHWNNLALIYKRKGDYVKEEELYRVSLMMEPNEPNTYNNLAVNLAHQGRYDEALQIMQRLEVELPDDPYTDLHRAKIYAAMGKKDLAYKYLRQSLQAMRKLDTLHNIEYQQDIRVDPAFDEMRKEDRFRAMLTRYYGDRPGGWWIFGNGGEKIEADGG